MSKYEIRYKISEEQMQQIQLKASKIGLKNNAYCKSVVLKEINDV